jgi:hypothetical protein
MDRVPEAQNPVVVGQRITDTTTKDRQPTASASSLTAVHGRRSSLSQVPVIDEADEKEIEVVGGNTIYDFELPALYSNCTS